MVDSPEALLAGEAGCARVYHFMNTVGTLLRANLDVLIE
jgi:hypothetical protein